MDYEHVWELELWLLVKYLSFFVVLVFVFCMGFDCGEDSRQLLFLSVLSGFSSFWLLWLLEPMNLSVLDFFFFFHWLNFLYNWRCLQPTCFLIIEVDAWGEFQNEILELSNNFHFFLVAYLFILWLKVIWIICIGVFFHFIYCHPSVFWMS